MVFAACSDQDLVQQEMGSDMALELRAEINQQYTTRANDGGFADGDQIGVFIVNYKDDQAQMLQPSGNHADNVCFTYDETSGRWTGSYQIYWKDKKTPIDAYGYYPFDAELTSTQAYPFCVQQNQRDNLKTGRQLSGYEASDFLWAKKEGVLPTAGAITLQHRHLMAGVKVVLTEGEGFDEGEWNNIEKNVLVENTINESTINLQTGIVDVLGSSSTKPIIPLALGRGAGGEAFFRAIVIPQTVAAANSLFSITIDGKSTSSGVRSRWLIIPASCINLPSRFRNLWRQAITSSILLAKVLLPGIMTRYHTMALHASTSPYMWRRANILEMSSSAWVLTQRRL